MNFNLWIERNTFKIKKEKTQRYSWIFRRSSFQSFIQRNKDLHLFSFFTKKKTKLEDTTWLWAKAWTLFLYTITFDGREGV